MPGSDPLDATTAGVDSVAERKKPVTTLRFVFRGNAGIVDEASRVVAAGATRVGRVRGDDAMTLNDDNLASREHATLHLQRGQLSVVDHKSRNGVFVNGRRVEEANLADGDVVRFGGSFAVVRQEDPTQRDVPIPELRGGSPAMQRVRMAVRRIAPEDATVLVTGPTGTGKELVARALHEFSRRTGPFVAVNCSAIQASLAESELFGHVSGAFTGADRDRPGYFRSAHGGTLLLDEIGDMPAEMQPKMLRAIESKQIAPVGSTTPVPTDVRIVAATHVDVTRQAREGSFRADLHARLAQLRIDIPPICERREDILVLLREHLEGAPPMTADLVDALLNADWPDNARELIAIATELRVWGKERERLDLELVAHRFTPKRSSAPPVRSAELSPEALRDMLTRHRGNIAKVAKEAQRSRTQVYRLLEKHGIEADAFR